MYERTTKVDGVLRKLGIAVIALSALFGFLALAAAAGSGHGGPIISANMFGTLGVIAGTLLIGFAAIIRLLDQIRGQSEAMLRHLGITPAETIPAAEELPKEIVKNSDGTFTVEGKTFDTVANARAYLDLLQGLRK